MKKGYHIYWCNTQIAKTGIVVKTTTSEERAIELFRKEYDEEYKILFIHD